MTVKQRSVRKQHDYYCHTNIIIMIIVKITISLIVIGLKRLLFSTNSLFQVVNGQFVIGQFNKPNTFKVVV